MILKTLDYRQSKNHSGVYEEWNYFDNITTASSFFDEEIKMTVAIILIAASIVFVLRLPAVRALCACAVVWLVMGLSVFAVNRAVVGPVLDPE